MSLSERKIVVPAVTVAQFDSYLALNDPLYDDGRPGKVNSLKQ